MRFSVAIIPLLAAIGALGSPVTIEPEALALKRKGGIAQSVYDNLVWYFKYASSAYSSDSCASPNGNAVVLRINQESTDTQGFVARDNTRKEIIVALRGSSSITDFLVTDLNVILTNFSAPSVHAPSGTKTHTGFAHSWDSIASLVISSVQSELLAQPGYSIVVSGHSLGGSLACLAAATFKSNFPDVPLRLYTFGQPRTGNPTFAAWVNRLIGTDNIFRVVHSDDSVPQLIPQFLGYRHHATEYWQTPDPATSSNTIRCDDSGEDSSCSDSILIPDGILAHAFYFNYRSDTAFC